MLTVFLELSIAATMFRFTMRLQVPPDKTPGR